MLILRSRPGAAAARPVDLRYAKLTPPKRKAGIAPRLTSLAASRPTAAGLASRPPVRAPGPVTFFAAPREAPPPPVVAAARPPVAAVTPPKPEEPAEPIGLRALLGW